VRQIADEADDLRNGPARAVHGLHHDPHGHLAYGNLSKHGRIAHCRLCLSHDRPASPADFCKRAFGHVRAFFYFFYFTSFNSCCHGNREVRGLLSDTDNYKSSSFGKKGGITITSNGRSKTAAKNRSNDASAILQEALASAVELEEHQKPLSLGLLVL